MNNLCVFVLAGGKGSRFKNSFYDHKVLVNIIDRPLIKYTVESLNELNINNMNIVCNEENIDCLQSLLGNKINYYIQKKYLGTGGCFKDLISLIKEIKEDNILIINGDTPIYENQILIDLYNKHIEENNDITFVCFKYNENNTYGKVVRVFGKYKIFDNTKLKSNFVNAGIYIIKKKEIISNIDKIKPFKNGEYGITSFVNDCKLKTNILFSNNVYLGLNTVQDVSLLIKAISSFYINKIENESHTIFLDKETTIVGKDVVINNNVVVSSNNIIKGKTTIGLNSFLYENNCINNSYIGSQSFVGPFAYLRGRNYFESNNKIGSFTEIKNSIVGTKTKIPHLSYVGDAILGTNINVGAGTIFCNYNGKIKNNITIGSNSFIGSNVNLIAPLTIGNNCFIAAGSTINKSLNNNEFAIERSTLAIKQNLIK